jgi:predicted acyl esterase
MKNVQWMVWGIAIAFLIVGPSFAQSEEGSHRIVTPTRLQVLFSGLETEWLKAVQQRDPKALDRLLSEEFEVWTAAPPGDPIPRDEWQREAFSKKLESFAIRQIAVRSLSAEIAVASFALAETSGKKQQSYFVVDVWNHAEGNWKCSDRYLSSVAPAAERKSHAKKKPTGKE